MTYAKSIAIAAFFSALSVGAHAQIKVPGGLKDKVKKEVSTATSTTDTKSDAGSGIVGPPAYDPENPMYRAYSIVRDEISSTRNVLKDENWFKNIEGRNDDAVRYLAKAKENLEKLQADPIESKKPYVKDLADQWAEVDALRASKIGSYQADQVYEAKIEAYYNFAIMDWGISDKSLEPSYTGYYAMRKDFEATRPEKFKSDYVQKRVADVDNFFKVEVYKVVPQIDAKVDGIIREMYEKNSSGEAYYLLNASFTQKAFEEQIEIMDYNRKFLLEDKSGIDAVRAKLDKEKAVIDEWINSGKHKAHKEKFAQAMLDAVRLAPSKNSNEKYIGMAKNGVNKGTASRVSITSDVWTVKKNEWGLPLYKYLPVDIAVKTEDGKCYLAYGQIRKEYEGGGVYGGEYFNYWGMQEEMNCANINK